MKTEQIVMCVVALALGMLVANMLTNVCGCKTTEGLQNMPETGFPWKAMNSGMSAICKTNKSVNICDLTTVDKINEIDSSICTKGDKSYLRGAVSGAVNYINKIPACSTLQCVNSAGVVSPPDSSGKCPAIPESESDACDRNGLQWDSEALAADGTCAPLQI